jgi:hypothetical protein
MFKHVVFFAVRSDSVIKSPVLRSQYTCIPSLIIFVQRVVCEVGVNSDLSYYIARGPKV